MGGGNAIPLSLLNEMGVVLTQSQGVSRTWTGPTVSERYPDRLSDGKRDRLKTSILTKSRKTAMVCFLTLSREGSQHDEGLIDVGGCVIGANLEADFLVALGHHRIVEAGGEDVVVAQMFDQRGGARRISNH